MLEFLGMIVKWPFAIQESHLYILVEFLDAQVQESIQDFPYKISLNCRKEIGPKSSILTLHYIEQYNYTTTLNIKKH